MIWNLPLRMKKLYMLQTRFGAYRKSRLKIACDLVDEGLINTDQALLMVDPKQLDTLLHPQFDINALKQAKERVDYQLHSGAAYGKVVFSAKEAR